MVGSKRIKVYYIVMKNQDPVLEVLEKLKRASPESMKQLIEAYKANGVEALDECWKKILRETIDANK